MNETLSKILHHPVTIPAAVGVASAAGGLVVGYLLGKKARAELHHPDQEELNEISRQVEESRARRRVVINEEELRKIDSRPPVVPEGSEEIDPNTWEEPEPEVIIRNVFAEAGDDWDYEVEKRNRDSTAPYVLHKDEFYGEELGFTQHTYTYFDGDDILADEEDKPIYNHETIVGDMRFGHGSGDNKVVYIRNEKRKEEYEIVKDPGLYSVEVLGLEIEHNDRVKNKNLEHSVLRMRPQE